MSSTPSSCPSPFPISSIDSSTGQEQTKLKSNYEEKAKSIINSSLWEIDQLPSYLLKIKQQQLALHPLVESNQQKASEACQSTLLSCKLALNDLDQLASQLTQAHQQLQSKSPSLSSLLLPLQQLYQEYQTLEFHAHYFQLLREWTCINNAPSSFTSLQAFTELRKKALDILGPCSFSQHLDCSLEKERQNLIDFYKAKVQGNLNDMGWPNKLSQGNSKFIHSFTQAYECLHSISEQVAIDTVVDSLRVRFEYHFLSDKPTNDLFHPEWYLSFLRTPLIEHQWFILTMFQKHYSIFIRSWKQLAIHKFTKDVPLLLDHPPLLLKTLLLLSTFICDIESIYASDVENNDEETETKTNGPELDDNGLTLPSSIIADVLDCLQKHIKSVVDEWMKLPTIWEPIEEEFVASLDSLSSLNATSSSSNLKRPLLWYKFSSYNEIFISLAKKLEPSFAVAFLEKVACSAVLNCSRHLETCFSTSSFLNSSSSSSSFSSASSSNDISFHFALLSLYPLFLQLLLDWSFEVPSFVPDPCVQQLNSSFKSLLSELIESVSLSLFHYFQSESPFLPFLAHFFHQAQLAFEASSTSSYQRFFRHCLLCFDDVFLQWLGRPVSRASLLRAYTPFHSLLSQFSPFPSFTLPKTQFIVNLAQMEKEQADFQIQSVLETGPEVFVDGFSIADYIKISQNLI